MRPWSLHDPDSHKTINQTIILEDGTSKRNQFNQKTDMICDIKLNIKQSKPYPFTDPKVALPQERIDTKLVPTRTMEFETRNTEEPRSISSMT